ncbi:MAG TPA: hypothetical protein VKA64_04880, partial [Gammaproteobacteria bacterium]|nr:hypothetical protein [Gammaproteobacteria bacterium]
MTQFQVVYCGALVDGFDRVSAREALVSRLGLSPEKVDLLLAKRRHVLKHVDSRKKAERYVRLLGDAGLQAVVEEPGESPGQEADEPAAVPPPYRPFPDNWLYKPALFLAAATEALLTVGYVAVLLGLLAGLFYQALFSDWLLAYVPSAAAAAVHALLVLAGVAAFALLLKPLLALRRHRMPGIALPEPAEPDLHAFVGDVCEAFGVPRPAEIRVSIDATLEAGYRRGWCGLRHGQTVLTIGLPLVASLDTRQLAGAVGRAMQPFDPMVAPRLGCLVEGQLEWLNRAVHEPDAVDRALRRSRAGREKKAWLLGLLVKAVAVARRPTAWRLAFSRRLCRRLIHRRVADADAAGRWLAGRDDYAATLEQYRLLTFAAEETIPRLRQTWETEGRLPANLAMALVARASQHAPEVRALLQQAQEQRVAAHREVVPSDRQRLARLAEEAVPARYRCQAEAEGLFQHLERYMHKMSVRYYQRDLGLPVTSNKLVRTPVRGSPEDKADRRLEAFFGGGYRDFVPLALASEMRRYLDDNEAVARWRRAAISPSRPGSEASDTAAAFDQADERLIEATCREAMTRAGLGFRLGDLALGGRPRETVQQACREAEYAYELALEQAKQGVRTPAGRLAAGLALLGHPEVQGRVPEAVRLQREANALLRTSELLERLYPQLRELRLQTVVLESVVNHGA